MEPQWDIVQTQAIQMTTFKKPPNLDAVIRDGRLSSQTRQEQVKIGDNPFAQGADRIVFHGILLAPPGVQAAAAAKDKRLMKSAMGTYVVFKQFKEMVPDMDSERFFYEEQAQLQAIAAFFAHDFSLIKGLNPPIQLRYVQSKVCVLPDKTLYSVEPEFQEGNFCVTFAFDRPYF